MPDLTAFSEEKTELKRLLASPSFLKSPNLSKLLQYLCNKHFEDCGRDLNEYSIAVEALGRTADFDPGISSIVRVEVHRLREKLNKYYEGQGADHPWRILLQPGSYTPMFVKREGLAPAALEKGSRLPMANGAEELPEGSAPVSLKVVGDRVAPEETGKTASHGLWGFAGFKSGTARDFCCRFRGGHPRSERDHMEVRDKAEYRNLLGQSDPKPP